MEVVDAVSVADRFYKIRIGETIIFGNQRMIRMIQIIGISQIERIILKIYH